MSPRQRLKARYCRLLDAKDWTRWREIFTDDFLSDTSASGGKRIAGADAFLAFVRANLGNPHRTRCTRSMRRSSS